MASLDIQLRIKCDRDIKKGEVLQLTPDEVYILPGYSYTSIMRIETTVLSTSAPKTVEPKSKE